jgi:hypothetical protein
MTWSRKPPAPRLAARWVRARPSVLSASSTKKRGTSAKPGAKNEATYAAARSRSRSANLAPDAGSL